MDRRNREVRLKMAIIPETEFPGKIVPGNASYPYGQARDITTPSDGTGTPLRASLVNDIFGFQQALLAAAGVTPSGAPDTAAASQYLQALQVLFAGTVSFTGTYAQWGAKLKLGPRTLTIKGGNVDYSSNPGEIEVPVSFLEPFATICATVNLTRKMEVSGGGDGGALLIGTPTTSSFKASLQVYNSASVAELRGFSWIAFGW